MGFIYRAAARLADFSIHDLLSEFFYPTVIRARSSAVVVRRDYESGLEK